MAVLPDAGVPAASMSDEQEFLHKLARLADREHQRRQALQARPQAWEIQPGSPLADDEAKSERLQRPGARRHPPPARKAAGQHPC